MAIDKLTIDGLLMQLNDYIHRIESMDFTLAEITSKKDTQDIIARRLQVAVEICIDIAMHLASGLNLPAKDTAADIFELLKKEGILKKTLFERIKEAISFRNLLVHGYAKVDYALVYKSYKDDLKDLREFARAIVLFLEKNPNL